MNWDKWQELMEVERPIRYVGREWNQIKKDPQNVRVSWALSFPDVYEVGMSHLGLKILYYLINSHPDYVAERVFAPWPDREAQLRKQGRLLHTLESSRPLSDFDIVGFSLQYELSYSNVLNMLEMGGIPVWAEEREKTPLVVAGGPNVFNPEPLADFIDCFFIGESEEMVKGFSAEVLKSKEEGWSREKLLQSVGRLPGIYVPALYSIEKKGNFFCPVYSGDGKGIIEKQVVRNLDDSFFPEKLTVPFTPAVHDRVTLEIARGCTRGCRFCQAGMIYRPVRERSLEKLKAQADVLLAATGYDEVSLLSLSTTDHSQIAPLVNHFSREYSDLGVGLSLPSLRIDAFSVGLAQEVQRVKKTGLTFAPEAGTQRLRNVINKGVAQADLLEAAQAAFRSGWTAIKLYFMIGLPTETDEDVRGIADLTWQVWEIGKKLAPRRPKITVSVATFVPKPHTPFQWDPLLDLSEVERRQKMLRSLLRGKQFNLSWHGGKSSKLEALLARGDRKMGGDIYRAWKQGARFDGWSEEFNPDFWQELLSENEWIHQNLSAAEPLPWDHIFSGVEKSFLQEEREKAEKAEKTLDCREGTCHGCGCCSNLKAMVEVFGGKNNADQG